MGLFRWLRRLFGGERPDASEPSRPEAPAPERPAPAVRQDRTRSSAPARAARRDSEPERAPASAPTAPAPNAPATLADLSGGADRIAVVDCETTGVYPTDRVIELAIVTLDLEGKLVEAWDTLIQPSRSVGPTHIHGLTASCLADAPEFRDVVGDIALRLDGACLAAHNFPFDYRMLQSEFERVGARFYAKSGIDTLTAAGAKLGVACETHDIDLTNAHSAIDDALAAAELLKRVIPNCRPGSPAEAAAEIGRTGRVYRRGDCQPVSLPEPAAIAALAARLEHRDAEPHLLGYLEILGRALADLHLDHHERDQLRSFAAAVGLRDSEVEQAHRRFLNDLIDEAVEDEVVTDEELDQLVRVASSLDLDSEVIERRIHRHTRTEVSFNLEPGLTVVFTGESEDGDRDRLIAHAASLGLDVAKNVTKSTDLVVAVGADSQTGRAKKARRYDIPIATASVFGAAGSGDAIAAHGSTTATVKAVTCPDCLVTWTVSARSGARASKRCVDCRG